MATVARKIIKPLIESGKSISEKELTQVIKIWNDNVENQA